MSTRLWNVPSDRGHVLCWCGVYIPAAARCRGIPASLRHHEGCSARGLTPPQLLGSDVWRYHSFSSIWLSWQTKKTGSMITHTLLFPLFQLLFYRHIRIRNAHRTIELWEPVIRPITPVGWASASPRSPGGELSAAKAVSNQGSKSNTSHSTCWFCYCKGFLERL